MYEDSFRICAEGIQKLQLDEVQAQILQLDAKIGFCIQIIYWGGFVDLLL